MAAACHEPTSGPADHAISRRSALSVAYCQARVTGTGVIDVETDYLPHVVQCENGAAGLEALKAQAVAARAYLYYKLDRDGEITDDPGDQVYGCGREPTALAYAAVQATSGVVLTYRGVQVAGFHVAGARHHDSSCQITPEQRIDDPTNTETYVTYNADRHGSTVIQTSLGLAIPDNRANRGCKSQNGAACLAAQGWRYDDILRFYYGEDIEVVQARGLCIEPLPQPGPLQGCGGPYSALFAMGTAMLVGWMIVFVRARSARGQQGGERSKSRQGRRHKRCHRHG